MLPRRGKSRWLDEQVPRGLPAAGRRVGVDSGRTVREGALELGVNRETLRNWVDKLPQERAGSRPATRPR